jgi:L-ascorbate metabolism protein UlaG (beta-lactamase superfamily)
MRKAFHLVPILAAGALADDDATRAARIAASPNFWDGRAHNLVERPLGGAGMMLSTAMRWLHDRAARTPDIPIPVVRPDPAALVPAGHRLRATWLGHSAVLLEIDGHLLLTDPMLGERSSPVSFAGPKRFFSPPLAPAELPPLDAVLLSHDHYDHLDEGTIRALAPRGERFLVPLGVGAYLEAWGVPPERITELDWWEETTVGALRVACAPAHHFSGRGAFDRDRTLWSSWAILGPQHRVLFGGDTGPLDAAEGIRTRYGPLDLVLLEIGAWDPAWASIHLGPDAAVDLHLRLGAAALMPIHYGSFEMALHPWDQPIARLQALAAERGLVLWAPLPGGTVAGPGVDPFWAGRAARAD